MPRVFRFSAIVFVYLGASYGLPAETPDPRLDDAVKEIALLKRMAADQDPGRGADAARPFDLGVDQRTDARAGDARAAVARGRAPGTRLDACGRRRGHLASR